MGYRRRTYFTEKQKAEIWDLWQRGESMSPIDFFSAPRTLRKRCRRHLIVRAAGLGGDGQKLIEILPVRTRLKLV